MVCFVAPALTPQLDSAFFEMLKIPHFCQNAHDMIVSLNVRVEFGESITLLDLVSSLTHRIAPYLAICSQT